MENRTFLIVIALSLLMAIFLSSASGLSDSYTITDDHSDGWQYLRDLQLVNTTVLNTTSFYQWSGYCYNQGNQNGIGTSRLCSHSVSNCIEGQNEYLGSVDYQWLVDLSSGLSPCTMALSNFHWNLSNPIWNEHTYFDLTLGDIGYPLTPVYNRVGFLNYSDNVIHPARMGTSSQGTAQWIWTGDYYIEYGNVPNSPSLTTYALNVSPPLINYGENFNININSTNGTYSDITGFTYSSYNKVTGIEHPLYDSSTPNTMLDFELISGIWYEYNRVTNAYDINLGANFPNPLIKKGNSDSNLGVGVYDIKLYLSLTDLSLITLKDDLTINNLNNQELVIETKDYLTGDLVASQLFIKDLNTNTWTNKTSLTGQELFWFPYNEHLWIKAISYGYIDSYKNWTVTNVPYYRLWVIMYRGITPNASDVSLTVSTFDGLNNAPLTSAYVQVSNPFNGSLTQNGYTNGAGIITFTIPNNTVWTVRGTKVGYQSAVAYLDTTGLGGMATEVNLLLQRSSSVTPMPTVSGVPLPTITMIGGNISPSVCGALPPHPSIVEVIKNNIACAGIVSGANQGYIFATIIICVCMFFGGKAGKGLGVIMGSGVGYVISLAMGLIPLWTFIAILVIAGIIFATKLVKA